MAQRSQPSVKGPLVINLLSIWKSNGNSLTKNYGAKSFTRNMQRCIARVLPAISRNIRFHCNIVTDTLTWDISQCKLSEAGFNNKTWPNLICDWPNTNSFWYTVTVKSCFSQWLWENCHFIKAFDLPSSDKITMFRWKRTFSGNCCQKAKKHGRHIFKEIAHRWNRNIEQKHGRGICSD